MDGLNRLWQAIDRVIFTLVKYACVALLGTLVSVAFYIFFGRYVLNSSPMWGEPLSRCCLVWLSILSSALVVRENAHLRVTMFDEHISKKAIFRTDVLASLCIVVFALFMIVYGWKLTMRATHNNIAGINVPYSYMYVSMPITGVLYLFGLVEMWRRRLVKA